MQDVGGGSAKGGHGLRQAKAWTLGWSLWSGCWSLWSIISSHLLGDAAPAIARAIAVSVDFIAKQCKEPGDTGASAATLYLISWGWGRSPRCGGCRGRDGLRWLVFVFASTRNHQFWGKFSIESLLGNAALHGGGAYGLDVKNGLAKARQPLGHANAGTFVYKSSRTVKKCG